MKAKAELIVLPGGADDIDDLAHLISSFITEHGPIATFSQIDDQSDSLLFVVSNHEMGIGEVEKFYQDEAFGAVCFGCGGHFPKYEVFMRDGEAWCSKCKHNANGYVEKRINLPKRKFEVGEKAYYYGKHEATVLKYEVGNPDDAAGERVWKYKVRFMDSSEMWVYECLLLKELYAVK